MNPFSQIQDTCLQLRKMGVRSLLTLLSIASGVAAVIVLVGIGEGATRQVESHVQMMGTNLLVVLPGSQRSGKLHMGQGTRQSITVDDADAIARQIPNVAHASAVMSMRGRVVFERNNWSTNVAGIPSNYLDVRDWSLHDGRPFTSQEEQGAAKVVLIGQTVARRIFGEAEALGKFIRIEGSPFQVIGVLARKGTNASGQDEDDRVFIPLKTAQSRLLRHRYKVDIRAVDFIMVQARDSESLALLTQNIRRLLRARHQLHHDAQDDFKIRDLTAIQELQKKSAKTTSLLMNALAALALALAALGTTNVMVGTVLERKAEIGLRRAVGARRQDIIVQFLSEAGILAMIGSGIGLLVGLSICGILSFALDWTVAVSAPLILSCLVICVCVGIAAGIYPSWMASRLTPIDALRLD